MKISKTSSLFAALKQPESSDEVIPYIERWLTVSPHAGLYEVDDRPYQTRNPDRASMNFHPSTDCTKCERLLYFERDVGTPVLEEQIDARLQAIFKMGSNVHAMIQAWFAAMSEMPGYPELVANEMRIEGGCFEGYGVGGYIDSVVRLPGNGFQTPIEIKSIGDQAYQRLTGPKPEHRLQVGCYNAWLESPFGIVLYFNKNTCEMKEYKVEPVDLGNVLRRWSNVRHAVAAHDPSSLSWGCSCGAKSPDWAFSRCPAASICQREMLEGRANG